MNSPTHKKNDLIAYGLLLTLWVFMIVIALLNKGIMGGADSYMHHLMAKWSFTYPHLLLDHWGKPLFTIFSAPFAQFGLFGSVIFNISTTILTSFISYKMANSLGVKNPWLAIPFAIFTPVLFLISFSSLTEPLFALFLIFSIYLFTQEKYGWSAVVISFIPFIRTEGVIFFPLFLFALIIVRKYKSIPFLLFGAISFSIIGFWVFDDIFWVITRLPYSAHSVYGHGHLLHFIERSPMLFGWPIIILFAIGIFTQLAQVIEKKQRNITALTLLLLSISFGYFLAHTIVWAFGLGSSAGLTRVMAGIAPIIAFVALLGFDSILQKFKLPKIINTLLPVIIALIVFGEGASKNRLPIPLDLEEVSVSEMADYIKENKLDTNFIFYSNPTVAYFLGLDHFSTTHSWNYIPFKNAESEVENGALIIWDAHFSPNDSRVPKADLENSTHYKKLKTVTPKNPFKVYSGQNYEVILFQKIPE